MSASFPCPHCHQTLQAESSWSGQQTQCPYCKNFLVIPNLSTFSAVGAPGSVAPSAASSGPREVLLLSLVNRLLSVLRSFRIFQKLGQFSAFVLNLGSIGYLLLGLIFFICSFLGAYQEANKWLSFYEGCTLLIGSILFAYVGLSVFKRCRDTIEHSEPHTIPSFLLNCVAICAAAMTVHHFINGINQFCCQHNYLLLLNDLASMFACLLLLCLSLHPEQLHITAGDGTTFDTFSGLFHFMGKSVLLIAPFLWTFNALYRIAILVIHLGANRRELCDVVGIARSWYLSILLLPVFLYIGYLCLDLALNLVKGILKSRDTSNAIRGR